MHIYQQSGGGIQYQTTPALAAKDAEIARLRAEVEELQDEIERLNEVVAAFSDYADQLSYDGKWANASDEQIEQNRIALELRRILGEIE